VRAKARISGLASGHRRRRSAGSVLRGAASFAVVALFAVLTVVGPGHASPGYPQPPVPVRPSSPPSNLVPLPTPIQHVFVVVMENSPYSSVLSGGSFERYLVSRYTLANHYYGVCHPSAPNYLALTSGATWQCGSDGYTKYDTENLGHELQRANLSWNGFEESMPTPCDTSDSYPYAVKHNPFPYYKDIVTNQTLCAAHDVGFPVWNSDVANGTLPTFAMFTPNLKNDGHDTGVTYGDHWLRGWLSPYLNATWFSHTVFFVLYDEGVGSNAGYNGTSGGHIYLVAASPYARANYTYATNGSHFSLLATIEWLLGLPSTGHNDSRTQFAPMKGLLTFPTVLPLSLTASSNVTAGVAPLAVAFDAVPGGGTPPYTYRWELGDGSMNSSKNVSHVFVSPGNYTVNVTVDDSAGKNLSTSLEIVVSMEPVPLSVSATVDRSRGPWPLTATFQLAVGGGTQPYTISWNFGDASSVSGGTTAAHTYTHSGNFTVVANVTDAVGVWRKASVSVLVYDPLAVQLHVNATSVQAGDPISGSAVATGGTSDGLSFNWTVAGRVVGHGPTIIFTPPLPGNYTLSVLASDVWGDRANASDTIRAFAKASSPPPVDRTPPGTVPGTPSTAGARGPSPLVIAGASVAIAGAVVATGWGAIRWRGRRARQGR
jgi:phosphatidylinositol-3-phosphatase